MANYRKSFNLRNGVQVDDDNFVVNSNGLVGIGTSVPTGYLLGVYGDVKITGLVTTGNLYSENIITGDLFSGVTTATSLNLTQGIVASGVVTATSFSGSASGLTGIYAIAVDGWYVDTIRSSISTSFRLGLGTTLPQYSLQIGGNPLVESGISFSGSTGDINTTGVITAAQLNGPLNASNLTGTIDNTRLPSSINVGIVTASSGFYGNLTGTALTASSIVSSANITVNSINSGFSTSGISTVHTTLHVPGNIGVGTETPNAQVHARKSGISSIQLTSDGSNSSIITFGRSINLTSNNGQIRFGNTDGTYTSSTEQCVDIINYDTGNLNFYLNPGGTGTGSYNWFRPSLAKIMTLTSSGNLGINSDSPTSRLSVVGTAHISGVTTVGSNLDVKGSSTTNTLIVNSSSVLNGTLGVSTSNPLYSVQVGNNPSISNGVGLSSSGGIVASGIVTAVNGFTSGIGVTTPVVITVIDNILTFTVPGVGFTSLTLGS